MDSVFLEFGEKDAEISERVRKLLKVMKKGIQYTSTELMERLGLKSKEGFRRNYIKPAIERGAVCMTNEENPRSRNQNM